MKVRKEKHPKFKSIDDEIEFWGKHDATDFFDFENPEKTSFPNINLKRQR
ncbi:hypothetical protein JWG40_10065 [Leptospira sp. 201903074]|nr:CopG family antitoxin [Leptospira abararensis]MBM9547362.1 hypothetical protein [Leptospira abararensis]